MSTIATTLELSASDELLLVERAQRGEVEAFNTLVLKYQQQTYNVAYRLLGDAHAAQDATQNAFISAYQSLTQFGTGSFRAWLFRIVTNTCFDYQRRAKRRPQASLDELTEDVEVQVSPVFEADDDSPEEQAAQRALSAIIQDCLTSLPDDQRLVAVLCDIQGYEYTEISRIANAPIGTVKSRLSRARRALRDCLQSAGELLPSMYRLVK